MPADPGWWVQTAVSFVGIIIGAMLIVWQMGRQHRSSLQVQRSGMRNELMLSVYREIAEAVDASQKALQNTLTNVEVTPMALQLGWSPPAEPEMRERHGDATKRMVRLLWTMEKWEIVIPHFRGIGYNISQKNKALMDAFGVFHDYFLGHVLPLLQTPDGRPVVPTTDETLAKHSAAYQGVVLDLFAYLFDLRVEAQNHLLGGIFDHQVPPRAPEDPTCEVLTTDDRLSGHVSPSQD